MKRHRKQKYQNRRQQLLQNSKSNDVQTALGDGNIWTFQIISESGIV
jgi:hypothetical protein